MLPSAVALLMIRIRQSARTTFFTIHKTLIRWMEAPKLYYNVFRDGNWPTIRKRERSPLRCTKHLRTVIPWLDFGTYCSLCRIEQISHTANLTATPLSLPSRKRKTDEIVDWSTGKCSGVDMRGGWPQRTDFLCLSIQEYMPVKRRFYVYCKSVQ